MIFEIAQSDLDGWAQVLPASVSLGADTLEVSFKGIVRLSARVSAHLGGLEIDIVRATAAGFGWFGAVRKLAGDQILKAAANRPGIQIEKTADGNLSLITSRWVDEASIRDGVLHLRMIED